MPFSVGDVLYVLGGAWLLYTMVRCVYYASKFSQTKHLLAASLLNILNAGLFIYLFFVWGWGANYYKPPLGRSWGLYTRFDGTKADRRMKDSAMLVNFNRFLTDKLNTSAPYYRHMPTDVINVHAKIYYRQYTDSRVKEYGLNIKPTVFSYFLDRLAIEGYYNPFTGEGQVSASVPGFMMPFVVCHEMAHQAGIAAEGDANLMAYALGSIVPEQTFNYSAYLNIWLYANRRLHYRDSTLAATFVQQLNPLTKAHLDTLEQLSRKYDNNMARYSSELYDDYLKLQQQKEGLRSYGNVVSSAWQLELKRMDSATGTITVP